MVEQQRASLPVQEPRLLSPLAPLGQPRLADDLEWSGADIRGDMSGQSADAADISESRLVGVRLTACQLDRLRMTDVLLQDCDLSGALLSGAALNRVRFSGCRLSGLVAPGASLRDVTFADCRMDGAALRFADGLRVTFDACRMAGADFYGATLRSARLLDCDLSRIEVSQATLSGARLHGSRLEGLQGADGLRGAVIDSSQVLPLAWQLLGLFGITVDDDRGEPPGRP